MERHPVVLLSKASLFRPIFALVLRVTDVLKDLDDSLKTWLYTVVRCGEQKLE